MSEQTYSHEQAFNAAHARLLSEYMSAKVKEALDQAGALTQSIKRDDATIGVFERTLKSVWDAIPEDERRRMVDEADRLAAAFIAGDERATMLLAEGLTRVPQFEPGEFTVRLSEPCYRVERVPATYYEWCEEMSKGECLCEEIDPSDRPCLTCTSKEYLAEQNEPS